MANSNHLGILQQGVEKWNLWRQQNPDVQPDLTGVDLSGCTLRNADLTNANLSGATLSARQLGGSDLTGATLPDHIAKFDALKVVDELSKNTRKVFLAMLIGCLYSWLTISATVDAQLITDTSSLPLPLVGTSIPIGSFYIASVVLLVGFYAYFHLYLQSLWTLLGELPARFQDGVPLDQKSYPWLLNDFVRFEFVMLKEKPFPLAGARQFSIFLAWYLVPVTLMFFWYRYLFRHDAIVTAVHMVVVTISFAAGTELYRLGQATLRGEDSRPFGRKMTWSVIALAVVLATTSFMAISGTPATIAGFFVVDIAGEDFREAELAGLNLRNANATDADFNQADLSGTDLRDANLLRADLTQALLVGARLDGAVLRESNMFEADLRGATLSLADLTFADLTLAHLEGTDLSLAVGLTRSQVDSAITDEGTILPDLEDLSGATPGA